MRLLVDFVVSTAANCPGLARRSTHFYSNGLGPLQTHFFLFYFYGCTQHHCTWVFFHSFAIRLFHFYHFFSWLFSILVVLAVNFFHLSFIVVASLCSCCHYIHDLKKREIIFYTSHIFVSDHDLNKSERNEKVFCEASTLNPYHRVKLNTTWYFVSLTASRKRTKLKSA